MQSETPQPARRKRHAFDWPTAILIAIVVAAAAYVLWRDGPARFIELIWSDSGLFARMLPNVLAGCLIAVAAVEDDKIGLLLDLPNPFEHRDRQADREVLFDVAELLEQWHDEVVLHLAFTLEHRDSILVNQSSSGIGT